MTTTRRPLTPTEAAECARLKAALQAWNAGRKQKVTQEQMAVALGMNQGSLSNYLNGHRALNKEIAAGISKLSGIPISAFSERIAQEIEALSTIVAPSQSASDIVRKMLEKHGKSLTDDARQRIADAVTETVSGYRSGNVITADFSRPGLVGDEIKIPHYDVRAAMGGGQIPADYIELLRDVTVSQEHLRRLGVDYESPHHLKMITGWGQSMEPTIQDKDPLLIDVSIDEFTGDGIYLFTQGEMLFIKRLQLEDEKRLKVISDNRNHDPRFVTSDDIYIKGRILLVWSAHRV